jgi:hypothetical protein
MISGDEKNSIRKCFSITQSSKNSMNLKEADPNKNVTKTLKRIIQ